MTALLAAVSIAASIAAGSSAAAQTPRSADETVIKPIIALDPRWTVALTTAPAAPPGFDQQMAYVPIRNGELLAIGLDDGRARWVVEAPTDSTPATGDGLVFVAGQATLTALEQRTGHTLWRATIDAGLSGPVYWDSGWLLASTREGDLLGIRAEDGRVLWRTPLASPLATMPTSSGELFFVALADGRVVAVQAASGAAVWTRDLAAPVTGLLGLSEQLLVGTRANRLHSLSLDRGRVRWEQKAGADVIGAPVADDQLIYFVAFDNVLRALSRGSGNLRWTRNLPSRPDGGALLAGDIVMVPFAGQVIGAYLTATGAEAFTTRATGELAGAPFLRESARLTAPRLIAMSRVVLQGQEGALQGFAPRMEPPPVQFTDLPGVKVGG